MKSYFIVWSVFLFFQSSVHAAIPSCGTLVRGRTLSTVAAELSGGDLDRLTPESLLGQYLKRSRAARRWVRFPNGRHRLGPNKLVIAVSPETFPLFYELFGETNPNLLEHLHTPNQGTLLVRWMTETFSYASPRGQWRFPTVGSIGPMILLSDTEAARLEKFWRANETGQGMCRQPNAIPGYGYPVDGYIGNCTAWFGHLPIGDAVDSRVIVAGSVDRHGDGRGRAPRRGTLRPYDAPQVAGVDPQLLAEVWSAPVHRRLWDLLDIPFELANHTNPGWVATSLTGIAKNDRVPFVVAYVENHRRLPDPFDPQINRVGE